MGLGLLPDGGHRAKKGGVEAWGARGDVRLHLHAQGRPLAVRPAPGLEQQRRQSNVRDPGGWGWSMRFEGRTALVTGGGRGIGKAVAVELAKGRAALVVNDLDGDRLEATGKELRGLGASVMTVRGDVSDPTFVAELVTAAECEYGRVDLLLNNVGGSPGLPFRPFLDTPFDDFRRIVDLNFTSQVMVLRAVLGGMVKRGYGRVVCVSSISAVLGQEAGSAYAAGKAALHGLVPSV